MGDYIYTSDGELYHWGVKGMKWGVRRYQNKDGSLTAAGEKRYNDIESSGKKSKHRAKLEASYQRNGMSEKEARVAADSRIRAEKFVAAAAGITVAACAAYAYKKYAMDRTIPKDVEFQRVIKLNAGDKLRPGEQYLAYNKRDRAKYKGLLAKHFSDERIFGRHDLDIQAVTEKFHDDVKVASPKRAKNTFKKLYENNSEFRNAFTESNQQMISDLRDGKAKTAMENIINKKTNKLNVNKAYDAFNIGLVNKSPAGSKAARIFYDDLKKQGVNAEADLNDIKYSGYKAKNPIIVFNGAYDYKGKVLNNDEIASNLRKATDDIWREDVIKSGAKKASACLGLIGGVAVSDMAYAKRQVSKYVKEHPNTKLTDAEILKMLNR